MVYIRSEFYRKKHGLPFKIIFGHTEFSEPQVQDDKICIDTGCGKYKDAPLTAIVIENGVETFVDSNYQECIMQKEELDRLNKKYNFTSTTLATDTDLDQG